TTRSGVARTHFAPAELESGLSFGSALIDDVNGSDDVYAHLLGALQNTPGRRGLRLDKNAFLRQFGDPVLAEGLSAGVQAILARDSAARANLSGRHLRYLLDRIVGPGLELPLVRHGRLHDYTTVITVNGRLSKLSDGDPLTRGGTDLENRRKLTTGVNQGQDRVLRGEVGLDGIVLGPVGRAGGALSGGPRAGFSRSKGHNVRVDHREVVDARYGPALTPEGEVDEMPLREFTATVQVVASTRSTVRLNANARRLSFGRPGRQTPRVVAAGGTPPVKQKLKLRLLVPEHRVSTTRPATQIAVPPSSDWIEHPTPTSRPTTGSRGLEGVRIESFQHTEVLQAEVRRTLERAANDPALAFIDGRNSAALADALAPERLTSAVDLFSQPLTVSNLSHPRRVADTTADVRVRLRPSNPVILNASEFEQPRRGIAAATTTRSRRGWTADASVALTGFVAAAGSATDQGGHISTGGTRVTATLTPWQQSVGRIKETTLTGLSKLRLRGRPERRFLVRVDVEAEIVAEAQHPSNLDLAGLRTPRTERAGRRAVLPGAVTMWLTRDQVHGLVEADLTRTADETEIELQHAHRQLLRDENELQDQQMRDLVAAQRATAADYLAVAERKDAETRRRTAADLARVQQAERDRLRAHLTARRDELIIGLRQEQAVLRHDRTTAEEQLATLRPQSPAPAAPPRPMLPVKGLTPGRPASFGIGGITTPVDLGDRIAQLRQRLADEVGDEAALALLPHSALDEPHQNVRALESFLSGVDYHAGAAANGGRTLPLRLEGRFRGHTYHVTLRASFPREPQFVGIEHVEELSVTDRAAVTSSRTKAAGRTAAGVAVTVQGQGIASDKPSPEQTQQTTGHGPGMVAGGGGITGSASLDTRVWRQADTIEDTRGQTLAVRGPVAMHRGDLRIDLKVTGHGLPAGGVSVEHVRTVDVHRFPSDSLPDRQVGVAGPPRPLPAGELGDEARLAWRTAPGHDRLPDAGRFAVEHLPTDVTDLHAAVEQALIASGVKVDGTARATIRDGLNVSTIKAGLPIMTAGGFLLPVPGVLDRHVLVDARLVAGPAFATANADVEIDGESSVARGRTIEEQAGRRFALRTTLPMVAGGVDHPVGARQVRPSVPGPDAPDPKTRPDFGQVTDRNFLETPLYVTDTARMRRANATLRDASDPVEPKPQESAGDDEMTRALSYRVEFRVIARSSSGKDGGGVGVSVADGAVVRMYDAEAERITGRELPTALRDSAHELATAGKEWSAEVFRRNAQTAGGGTTAAELAAADMRLRLAEDTWWRAYDRHDDEVAAFREAPGRVVWTTDNADRVVGKGGYDADGLPQFPGGTPQLARVFDAYDPAAGGEFGPFHPVLSGDDEHQRVLRYLSAGTVLLDTAAREPDVYDSEGGPVVPLGYRTDGRWVWSEATAYYLATYGLSPDPALLDHIRANHYQLPQNLGGEDT
ncbi:MAG TPA: hypothetical protein VFG35_15380, partial [Actinoplanes sp.]|nr:hypothetical protein [Actinoplanes sp.]